MKKLPLNLMVGVFIAVVQFYFTSCKPNSKNTENNPALLATFTVNELQADFKQFRHFLEDSHPRMYRFTSRWEFDSLFDAQYMSIENPMTAQKFYGILAPLTAAVGCGHTSLWTPKGFWDEAPQQMFPLGIHAHDGQLYLVHSYNREPPVKYGSRILSVNGQRAEDLVNRMTGNISSDGFIMTKRYQKLNLEFPYLYALNFGFPGQFDLVVMEEGSERQISLEPVSRHVIKTYRNSLVNTGVIRGKELLMEQLDEQTALLFHPPADIPAEKTRHLFQETVRPVCQV